MHLLFPFVKLVTKGTSRQKKKCTKLEIMCSNPYRKRLRLKRKESLLNSIQFEECLTGLAECVLNQTKYCCIW